MNPSRPILSLEELEAFDPHAPAGARRRFCCPLCGGDKSRDSAHRCLSLETATGLWRCFRCEASGQLRDKWQDRPPLRAVRAQQATRRAFAVDAAGAVDAVGQGSVETSSAPDSVLFQAPDQGAALPLVNDPLRRALGTLRPLTGTAGESYLLGRGLSLKVCLEARVKFTPSWSGRPAVVFPLYNHQGHLVAAQGRHTDGRTDPKARTLGPKKEGVFLTGNFWEQVKSGAPVVITEAPIDALSLAVCGFPALALCGKSGWPSWLPVKCAFKEVAIAFDADAPGEEGAHKLAPVLESLGAHVRRVVPTTGNSGAEAEVNDWNEMLLQLGVDKMSDWLCLYLL